MELLSQSPTKWQQFLRVSANRIELCQPLNNGLKMVALTIPASQELVIAEVKDVHSNPVQNTGNISPYIGLITKMHIQE